MFYLGAQRIWTKGKGFCGGEVTIFFKHGYFKLLGEKQWHYLFWAYGKGNRHFLGVVKGQKFKEFIKITVF